MATPLYSSKLSGSKFKNWIKAGLGVLYTKEGIEPFVYDEIVQFQQKCLSDICNDKGLPAGTTCSSCCTENVIVCPTDRICNVGRGKCKFHRNSATQYLPSGCPNRICHNFKNEIQNAHRFCGPSYKNTDATQWCSNTWEVAKCFMPPDRYKDVINASETNFNGIVSVIINYKAFQSKVHDDLSRRINIFHKAREVGKAVTHSSYLEMEDEDLQQYFSILQNLLSDPGYLATNSSSQNAKKKLTQLQNDTLVIDIEDIRKVLDDVAKAVENELRTEKDEHTKKAEKQKLELIKITNKSVSAFKRQEKWSMFELDKVISAVVETEVHTKEPVIEDHSIQKSHQHEAEAPIVFVPIASQLKQSKMIESRRTRGRKRKADHLSEASSVPVVSVSDMPAVTVSDAPVRSEVVPVPAVTAQDVDSGSSRSALGTVTAENAVSGSSRSVSAEDAVSGSSRSALGTVHAEDPQWNQISETDVNAVPSVKDLDKIAQAIGLNWELLGPHLGIPKATIDHIKMDNKTSQTRIHQMLYRWKNQNPNGTKQNLFTAFGSQPSTNIDWKTLGLSFPDALKYKPREENKHLRSQAEQDYEERKTHLREDLIGLYREEYHTLPLSPLLEENDTPLLEFYVIPDIESVEIQRARGGGKEARSKVTSLHDVFYKKNEPCRKIYLTADAGFGKTALSKRLVLTWCQAKNCIPNEDKHFKKEDISTMSNFDFVFLLSLRDCSEEWDIDEMIKKQITNDLAHTISTSDFENILSNERCLIILDGLDEFTHAKSDIPRRKARRTCTILTTTRPWKLGVSKIRASEIERKLELVGLSKSSARRLKRSVISLLWGETDIEKHIQEFDRAVSERGISDLETIPLLLVYLLCLWCDETDLGKSRTELYCQIANLLLKRTFEKYPDMKQSCVQPESDIPQCISRNEHCRKHYNLLNALGRLAFETLFDETKDQNLVFDMAVAEKCLSDKDLLQLSRHSGIITHDKDQTKINKQMQKNILFTRNSARIFCSIIYQC
ncbi:uncharacterized protein LOC123540074 isoform X2 [Mercenaria mercenaria]|uniref:uncharacterized protein LOC123540074 isoform X2 n=1 Tax=Mercenaria mercenaria TaxID=6596 RepID=UPI00234EEEB9|nr:uncharacterized protein LOC123540074 isoform X2 [Mercenaria mercenaria]